MKLKHFCLSILFLLTTGFVFVNESALGRSLSLKGREKIFAEVTRLGGTVECDETRAGKPIIKIDLHGTQVTDADLIFLNDARNYLRDLRYLDLRLTHIGDAGVLSLRNLISLQTLNLFRTNLGDKGLSYIRKLTQLQTLLIGGTKVTDAGLIHLKRFSELKKLSLFQTQVTDAGIPHLKALPHLEQLLISGSKISEAGTRELLKALPNLKLSEQT
jgi:internalin A